MRHKNPNLTEEELIQLCYSKGLDPSILYCKECGKLLIYEGAYVRYQSCNGKKGKKGDLKWYGHCFLETKTYGDQTFRLCKCKDCLSKKFPEINEEGHVMSFYKFANITQEAFDIPEDIFRQFTKERQGLTLDRMISLYGKERGEEAWQRYCKKQGESNKFDYKHDKYGMTIQEFKDYNKSRSCTLENFIKRHGEDEGQKLWDAYIERQRFTMSLDYFVQKYGDDKGVLKYSEFISSLHQTSSGKANDFFDILTKDKIFKDHEIFYDRRNSEFDILGYRLDFYDKTLNFVIEFNGDLWHANPKFYKNDEIIEFPGKRKMKVSDIWKYDQERKQKIIDKLGCKFIIVWEKDVDENIENVIYDIKRNL